MHLFPPPSFIINNNCSNYTQVRYENSSGAFGNAIKEKKARHVGMAQHQCQEEDAALRSAAVCRRQQPRRRRAQRKELSWGGSCYGCAAPCRLVFPHKPAFLASGIYGYPKSRRVVCVCGWTDERGQRGEQGGGGALSPKVKKLMDEKKKRMCVWEVNPVLVVEDGATGCVLCRGNQMARVRLVWFNIIIVKSNWTLN